MKEACVGCDQSFIPHHETTKGAQPRKGALHDPAVLVAAQLSSILMSGLTVVATGRDDGLNPMTFQTLPQWVAVKSPVSYEPIRALTGPAWFARSASGDRLKSPLKESDLRRGCRVQGCSQRRTLALDQNHPLRALAPLGLADFVPPFWAGAKLPSAKHSSQRSFCRSFSWARKARHISKNTPFASHSLSLLQQVEGLPYSLGSALQGAPVQRIPSKQRRSSPRGLPPLGLGLYGGR